MAVRYFNSLLVPQTLYCAKVESIVTILRTQGVYYFVLTQTGKMRQLYLDMHKSVYCILIDTYHVKLIKSQLHQASMT